MEAILQHADRDKYGEKKHRRVAVLFPSLGKHAKQHSRGPTWLNCVPTLFVNRNHNGCLSLVLPTPCAKCLCSNILLGSMRFHANSPFSTLGQRSLEQGLFSRTSFGESPFSHYTSHASGLVLTIYFGHVKTVGGCSRKMYETSIVQW